MGDYNYVLTNGIEHDPSDPNDYARQWFYRQMNNYCLANHIEIAVCSEWYFLDKYLPPILAPLLECVSRMRQVTSGVEINRRASLGARITELRSQIPDLEKMSRKTPPKSLKAEWAKVEAAKVHLPVLVAELNAVHEEYKRLRMREVEFNG